MPNNIFGANEFTDEDLADIFGTIPQETPPVKDDTHQQTDDHSDEDNKDSSEIDKTKAFAKRLKESTDKARQEEREAIAKSFGYDSYEAMQKANEKKAIEDKGLNPEEVAPIVNELVEKRINNDPRMQELSELRKEKLRQFADKELSEVSKLTGGKISKINDIPQDVLELWKTEGSLKSAYLKLHGEELIIAARSEQHKGSTDHLMSASGNGGAPNKRSLTEEEKQAFRFFNPEMSDDELNKMTVDK